MKKKFCVIVREIVGNDSIRFSKVYDFPCEESALKFFYTEIGSFLYSIDDIYNIFKSETDNKMQLDIFCRGFHRHFMLLK